MRTVEFVCVKDGNRLEEPVSETDTLLGVKTRLAKRISAPVHDLELIYAGNSLAPDDALFFKSSGLAQIEGSVLFEIKQHHKSPPSHTHEHNIPPTSQAESHYVSLTTYGMVGLCAGMAVCFGYLAFTSPAPYTSHIKPSVICGLSGMIIGAVCAIAYNNTISPIPGY